MKVTSNNTYPATSHGIENHVTPKKLPEKSSGQEPDRVKTDSADVSQRESILANQMKAETALFAQTRASSLQSTLSNAMPANAAPKTQAAQNVESKMEKTKANGGNTRDVVVAGAKADEGHVDVRANGVQGEDRLREIYKSSGIDIGPNPTYDSSGQPMLPIKDGKKKANSWCGVWAVDIWKRAGVPAKWGVGQGPIDPATGKKLRSEGISGNNDPKLQNVKPGDIVVIDDYVKDNPKEMKKNSLHHHAIVTSVVYEVPGQPPSKVTHPPDPVPKEGRVVGFHTMNGNSPGKPEANGRNSAIREGYTDITRPNVVDKNGKEHIRRISSYYPMPTKPEA